MDDDVTFVQEGGGLDATEPMAAAVVLAEATLVEVILDRTLQLDAVGAYHLEREANELDAVGGVIKAALLIVHPMFAPQNLYGAKELFTKVLSLPRGGYVQVDLSHDYFPFSALNSWLARSRLVTVMEPCLYTIVNKFPRVVNWALLLLRVMMVTPLVCVRPLSHNHTQRATVTEQFDLQLILVLPWSPSHPSGLGSP